MKKVILSLLLLTAAPVFGHPRGTIAQQKMCAVQANKFARQVLVGDISDAVQSHYDVAAHACYVRLDVFSSSTHKVSVYDAFEGKLYALLLTSADDSKTISCVFKGVACHDSSMVFDLNVERYFGLGLLGSSH